MRIVFSPESYNLGETTRCLEVARAAADRGHDVFFHVYSARHLGLIEQAGMPVRLADPQMSDAQARQVMALDQGRGVRHPFDERTVRARVEAEVGVLRTADAAVIGSNPTMFVSARAASVPLFYIRPYYMSRSYVMEADDAHRASWPVRRLASRLCWKPGAFVRVAKENGVELPRQTLAAMSGDVDLIASVPPLLDGRALAASDVPVGPIHYRPDTPLPQVLENRDRGRPLVYVSLGSSGSPRILGRILQQLDATGHEVLVGGGVEVPARVARGLGPRIHLAGLVPEHRLHGHIDAAITHGGEGTIQAMCLAGVPWAGFPMQSEQRWNIEECRRRGHALRLRRADLLRSDVSTTVERLLTDTSLRREAERLREQVVALYGASRAVQVIEDCVGDR